jgi:hypothetical protein
MEKDLKRMIFILFIICMMIIGIAVAGCSSELPEPEQEEQIYHPLEKHP